jgi:Helix-turn-helix domain
MKKETIRAAIDARNLPMKLFGGNNAGARTRKLVFLTIASYANPNGTNAFPSTKTLSTKCGIGERQIERITGWLKDNKLLQIGYKQGKRGTNLYRVLFPKDLDIAVSTSDPDISKPDLDTLKAEPDISGVVPRHSYVTQPEDRIDREREEKTPAPAQAKISRYGKVNKSNLIDIMLMECQKQEAKVSARFLDGYKSGSEFIPGLRTVVKQSDWSEGELIRGITKTLKGLDEYMLRSAGDYLLSGLAANVQLERENKEKEARMEADMQEQTANAREKVEEDLRQAIEIIEEEL